MKGKKINWKIYVQYTMALGGILGFILGILYGFGGFIYDLNHSGFNIGTVLAFLAIVGMPIIGMFLGFLVGILEMTLYNKLLRRFIPLDQLFEDEKHDQP